MGIVDASWDAPRAVAIPVWLGADPETDVVRRAVKRTVKSDVVGDLVGDHLEKTRHGLIDRGEVRWDRGADGNGCEAEDPEENDEHHGEDEIQW